MALEVDGRPEGLVADLADVVPLARVDLAVDGERVLARELLAAVLALELLDVGVEGLLVVAQVAVLPEPLVAGVALERPLV